MSVYMTEAEQLEAIKKWWKRYSNVITVILSVILLVISGFKYWNWHQAKIEQQASNAYEHLMVAFSNHDNKSVYGFANQLLADYGQTVYADAARLTLAKLYVLRDRYPKAQEELQYVATHSKVMVLQQIARIRLARLWVNSKSYDQALNELNHIQSSIYKPVVNELRGDIYAATGQYQQAVSSYREAMNEVQMKGMGNLMLEMKTNELIAMSQSMTDKHSQTETA